MPSKNSPPGEKAFPRGGVQGQFTEVRVFIQPGPSGGYPRYV